MTKEQFLLLHPELSELTPKEQEQAYDLYIEEVGEVWTTFDEQ